MKMKCEICNKEIKDLKGLSVHLSQKHKFDKFQLKEYYDNFLKREDEGKCYFCDNEAIFKGLTNGYHKICNSKECLGKTRATGTYEFLMYKYELSKSDAIKLMNSRAIDRGEKIKNGLQKSFEVNDNFFKEKSHQSTEYWLKKGFSKEESLIRTRSIMNHIHEKTSYKRKNNPELYKNSYSNQIGYWLKRGFSEDESKEKIKERQRTFTLEKCIEKHGEIKGLQIWNTRQKKWSEKIETKYKNGDFVKFRNDNYSEPELELFDIIIEKLDLKCKNIHYGKNQFYYYFKNLGKTFSYDFVFNKKIIEFNGDYWHCNPKMYNKNYFHKYLQMFAYEVWEKEKIKLKSIKNVGYEVLVIWECDFKKNKQATIQQCIDFINK